MVGRPRVLTDAERKEKNKERQDELRERRKESGLQPVTLYLDDYTLDVLTRVCREHGYPPPEKTEKNKGKFVRERNAEVLSNVIGYCIRKEAACKGMDLPETSRKGSGLKEGQELYRVRRVAQHRLKCGDKIKEIANFMGRHYRTIEEILGNTAKIRRWPTDDVKFVLDEKKAQKCLKE